MKTLCAALVLLAVTLALPDQTEALATFFYDGYLTAYFQSAIGGFGCL